MPRTRLYRNGVLECKDFPVADVSEHLAQQGTMVWIDLGDAQEADLDLVSEELRLHELALEDALHRDQRPKVDRYATHLFVSATATSIGAADDGDIELSDVHAFVTHNAFVTVRPGDRFDIDAVMTRWDDSADLAKFGVPYLLHGLLDVVVDSHFATVQRMDDEIEELEEMLFQTGRRDTHFQRHTYQTRKNLVKLRRVVLPMREVVNSLMRRDLHVYDEAMSPYFQDVYDHVLRASEWTESLRDLVTTILETNLTIQGNRLNVITKKVTSWAAIIAVPTAVTGFYGQNIPYPGFAQASGFWASTALIVVMSTTLWWLFKQRDWL